MDDETESPTDEELRKMSFNRKATWTWVNRYNFPPDDTYFCGECGRTIILKERLMGVGVGKAFCTCESHGPQMLKLVTDDDD